jgi:peptide/nickel transport system substrate-binding protein
MKHFVRAAALLSVLALGLVLPVSAQGSTLTIATGTDIESLNFFAVTSSPSFTVLEHINEPLFEMSAEGELRPVLAESISAVGDNVYIITLKRGISFTDGTPFNAEAVKANLDYVLNPDNAAPFRFMLVVAGEPVQVEVVDEYTIQITTAVPFAPLPAHLIAFGMISPAALAQGADFLASNTIGTGPYMLSRWDRAEQVVLTRNPNYWGEPPQIETLIFKVVPEAGARIVEIESGTVDVAVRIPPADIPRLQMNPDINVEITPGLRTIYIFFNTTDPLFDDVRVRQAFNYAVDKEAIAASLFEGAARVSEAPFAPRIFGFAPQTPYPRDLERARQLLAEAGVPEGTSVVLFHPTGRYPQDALVADAVRAQLADIGINVELRTLEWPQYVPHVRRPKPENDIQFAMLGWSVGTMDADYALFPLFHSSSHPPGFNGAFYSNPEVDRLLDFARSTLDQEERRAAYAEAIEIIWEDAPWLFLYSEIQVTAIRSNVEGFIVHPDESLIATRASIN